MDHDGRRIQCQVGQRSSAPPRLANAWVGLDDSIPPTNVFRPVRLMTAAGWAIVITLAANDRLPADEPGPSTEAIRAAVVKALPLLEAGAKGSLEKRKQCFTCHNQGLAIMALTTARSRGIDVDGEHLQAQLKFIAEFLGKNKTRYLEGKGQGGQIDTAGYALWTLDLGGWKPDETTAAVTEYFLIHQNSSDHYQPTTSKRPPSEKSHFTSSYVALRGLKRFGTDTQRERIQQRIAQVRAWLLQAKPEDTEDTVFRLRALQIAEAPDEDIRRAQDDLLQLQRDDGGWGQLPDMASDPYATGTALVALHQAGNVATDDPAYRRGLSFLLRTQLEDGSWHVQTRSVPIQTYFESGYPHGADQFISSSAAGWSTTALALALPK